MPRSPDDVRLSPGSTFVGLASVTLPRDPALHVYLSCAHLCFFQIERSIDDDLHRVRVAALPHRLRDEDAGDHVAFIYVSARQLDQALHWDRTLQGMPTSEVHARLETHLAQAGKAPAQRSTATRDLPRQPCNTTHLSAGATAAHAARPVKRGRRGRVDAVPL